MLINPRPLLNRPVIKATARPKINPALQCLPSSSSELLSPRAVATLTPCAFIGRSGRGRRLQQRWELHDAGECQHVRSEAIRMPSCQRPGAGVIHWQAQEGARGRKMLQSEM